MHHVSTLGVLVTSAVLGLHCGGDGATSDVADTGTGDDTSVADGAPSDGTSTTPSDTTTAPQDTTTAPSDTGTPGDTSVEPDTSGPCPSLPAELAQPRWPMPGEGGSVPPQLVAKQATVVDDVTGLEWTRSAAPKYAHSQAVQYCDELELGGNDDWRLPSRVEMISLMSLAPIGSGLDPSYFPASVQPGARDVYWTASNAVRPEICHATWFGVSADFIGTFREQDELLTRCVRVATTLDVPPPDQRFSVEGDVVVDHVTGLVWQRDFSTSLFHPEALAYCGPLNRGGRGDFRMPTHKELATIVDERRSPAVDEDVFGPHPEFANFWTATHRGSDDSPTFLDTSLSDGESFGNTVQSADFVRCVADAACTPSCVGRACGADGCGGTCGEAECGEDQRCALDGSACGAPGTCSALELRGTLQAHDDGFTLDVSDLGLGAAELNDALEVSFGDDASGTFTLGSGANGALATCQQCVVLRVDGGARRLFATGGTLQVAEGSQASQGHVTITLTGVIFGEISVDAAATPIADGACAALTAATSLSTDDTFACRDISALDDDPPAPASQANLEYFLFGAETDLGLGGDLPDIVALSFFTPEDGVHDLGTLENSQSTTCQQCVYIFEDVTEWTPATLPVAAHEYFQRRGTMIISGAGSGPIDFTLRDLVLDEVVIDRSNLESTRLNNGVCMALDSLLLQTTE